MEESCKIEISGDYVVIKSVVCPPVSFKNKDNELVIQNILIQSPSDEVVWIYNGEVIPHDELCRRIKADHKSERQIKVDLGTSFSDVKRGG